MDMDKAQAESDRFHKKYYTEHNLYEAGSWLEKPNSSVMQTGELLTKRSNIQAAGDIQALDLGAGVGRNAIPLVKLFGPAQVVCTCVDILPEATTKLTLNAAAENVADRIVPICSSIADYEIAPNSFHFIMALSGLEHAYNAEQLPGAIQSIQNGTKTAGFNCLSITTDLQETDLESGQELEPLIKARISAHECQTLLSQLYSNWTVKRLDFADFSDQLVRDGRQISWQARYCMLVAEKRQ